MINKVKTLLYSGGLVIALTALAACTPAATPEPTAVPPTDVPATEAPAPTDMPATEAPAPTDAPMANASFLERAKAGEFKGTVVTMTGPFVDEDALKFNNAVAAFEEETGIDIQYEGSK
ncbi:MAG TPA: hypothetical protein PK299_15745, partial [Anaerolineales bacterium]|nr:hypothetical protein [Anaerolineales bacterium]